MHRLFQRAVRRRWPLIIGGILVVLAVCTTIGVITLTHPPQPYLHFNLKPTQALQKATVPHAEITAVRANNDNTGPLLIFLPATGAIPQLYHGFQNLAAQNGYHVLSIPYANKTTEHQICNKNAQCYGDAHHQQVTGEKGPYLTVSSGAAIQPTIVSSLQSLAKQDANGKWGSYLHGDSIQWSNIVVAGHSQGGGLAAYIAHQQAVKGVIMLASPNDTDPRSGTVATWLETPSKTPASRYYGVTDVLDFYHTRTILNWHTMLPNIAVTPTVYKPVQGQQLFTSSAHIPPTTMSSHFTVALDPAYAPLWTYFLKQAKT